MTIKELIIKYGGSTRFRFALLELGIEIPLQTIKNWMYGTRKPSGWVVLSLHLNLTGGRLRVGGSRVNEDAGEGEFKSGVLVSQLTEEEKKKYPTCTFCGSDRVIIVQKKLLLREVFCSDCQTYFLSTRTGERS